MLKRTFSLYKKAKLPEIDTDIYTKNKIKSWAANSYGDISELQLQSTRIPVIKSPDELLIKVRAASVNPIDRLMLGGYGRAILSAARNYELEFPLIVGRDFSGTVVAKGHNVGNGYEIGDHVYGFKTLHKPGSFSELVLAHKDHVQPHPSNLDHIESTSLVYASMTAWGALFVTGNLLFRSTKGVKVLILGASGGVGTIAIQLLKSQGCMVFATCSGEATPLVQSLGADCIFDYNDENFDRNVAQEARYDIVLDCAKIGFNNVPKNWKFGTYITLNSPLLVNTDTNGLVGGLFKSASTLASINLGHLQEGKCLKWGFFVPSGSGFEFIHKLISQGKIRPVIHTTVNFENLPDAFNIMAAGHLRGKIVIDYC